MQTCLFLNILKETFGQSVLPKDTHPLMYLEMGECFVLGFPNTVESFMLNDSDLAYGQLRLLDVNDRLYLPKATPIRLLVSSDDVLHS